MTKRWQEIEESKMSILLIWQGIRVHPSRLQGRDSRVRKEQIKTLHFWTFLKWEKTYRKHTYSLNLLLKLNVNSQQFVTMLMEQWNDKRIHYLNVRHLKLCRAFRRSQRPPDLHRLLHVLSPATFFWCEVQIKSPTIWRFCQMMPRSPQCLQ